MPVDLSEALEEHRRGNLEWAVCAYQSILEEDPDHPDALYLLGVIAIQKGDPKQAVRLIGRAAALRPDDAVIHANLAEAYRALGDTDRTVDCYRTALRLDANHANMHNNLALALMSRREFEAAIGHFRAAIQLQPDFAAAHHGLGKALQTVGQFEFARDSFLAAARLLPGHATCHVSLAHVLEQLGEFDGAMGSFRDALRCDPRHPGALARLASRLREKLPVADQTAIECLLADPTLPLAPGIQLRFALRRRSTPAANSTGPPS